MTLTISFGWWIVPAWITISSLALATYMARQPPSTQIAAAVDAFISLMFYGAAIIVSLIAWLVWAVLT